MVIVGYIASIRPVDPNPTLPKKKRKGRKIVIGTASQASLSSPSDPGAQKPHLHRSTWGHLAEMRISQEGCQRVAGMENQGGAD